MVGSITAPESSFSTLAKPFGNRPKTQFNHPKLAITQFSNQHPEHYLNKK
ncbi:hypothetical protein AM1_5940 [Acaryochloris marina MBIC11017]|uniref:Uncharacterized protein n=1 Tax=Acaryochloris marina (strain MBIC 11017) TaxID=329726 RepID=B0C1P5_ACAM1|nr:hypothetical protein AM1_5940 [Acaryochloris marina MBIC11017]